jgi:hypothetical protein
MDYFTLIPYEVIIYLLQYANNLDITILQFVSKRFREIIHKELTGKIIKCYNITKIIALHGYLPLLQWARANSCSWNSSTCNYAAFNGHTAVLQWARNNGCHWDKYTCANAACNGHLATLQWARNNGCDWDEYTCGYAAQNGHLHILQWARQNGCDWDKDDCILFSNAYPHILEWIETQ